MPVKLHMDSIDDDPQEIVCADMDEAVARAREWFAEGYDNDSIPAETKAELPGDLAELEAALRAGREYSCSRFRESVRVTNL